ncbi:oligosaccharide flippase family protein [Nonomuraea sp. B10E15]|uniref:oligosaccharide flippase family protein n=1 Tax=unclassified Nonomuraea TaxID=2593643 RepID=UPI00325EDEEE
MAATAELGGKFKRGLAFSLINTVLSRLVTFTLGIVLARILTPEEFGIYATALLVQLFLMVINDLGVGNALIRREGEVKPMIPTAWTMSVGGGLICTILAYFGSGTLAWALGSPNATGVLQLMSLNILINGFASVPASVLAREFRQGKRLKADAAGLVVNVTLTFTLAMTGFGPWSLAIGHVTAGAFVNVLLMALSGCWPVFGFDRRHSGEVARVGLAMAGSSVLLIALQGTAQAVTGRFLGEAAIGLFFIANNVANWPIQIISKTLERVALPTFARAREGDGDFGTTAGTVIGVAAGAVLICGTGLAVLAEPIVQVVYGHQWLAAATMLAGLALANVARIVAELVFHLLIAANSMLISVLPQLAWLLVLVPASAIGAHVWGFEGIGWAQAAVGFGWAVPVHLWCARKAGARLGALLRTLVLPVSISAVLALLLLGLVTVAPNELVAMLGGGVLIAGALLLVYRQVKRLTAIDAR